MNTRTALSSKAAWPDPVRRDSLLAAWPYYLLLLAGLALALTAILTGHGLLGVAVAVAVALPAAPSAAVYTAVAVNRTIAPRVLAALWIVYVGSIGIQAALIAPTIGKGWWGLGSALLAQCTANAVALALNQAQGDARATPRTSQTQHHTLNDKAD